MMIKNEKGSVALLTLYIFLGVIILCLILSQFFSVYIVRRQAQNATDSAAIAAAQVLKAEYENAMKTKVSNELGKFWDQVRDEIKACEDRNASRGEDEEPEECPTPEELVEDWISNKDLEKILINNLWSTTIEKWVLVVKEHYFSHEFTAEKNGEVLYDVCKYEVAKIRDAALRFAKENNGNDHLILTFPHEGEPKILTKGHRTLSTTQLITVNEEVPAEASALIDASFPIEMKSKVPFQF